MVKKNYQSNVAAGKKVAKVIASNQRVSLKYATELCREIKGKKISRIDALLNNIIAGREFLPLRKYKKKVAHRKGSSKGGVKSGRYPKKLAITVLKILGSVKANADFKGMDAENLVVLHAFASQGFKRTSLQSQGRIGGKIRKRKSAHIEIVAGEAK